MTENQLFEQLRKTDSELAQLEVIPLHEMNERDLVKMNALRKQVRAIQRAIKNEIVKTQSKLPGF